MHLKVLSVDDSEIISTHINGLCQTLEHIELVGQAFGLTEAHEMLEAQEPDVVILDIALKGESGIDFLTYVKNNHPKKEVIVLTNNTDTFYRRKCESIGTYAYLDKSYEFDKLPEILNNILQKKINSI